MRPFSGRDSGLDVHRNEQDQLHRDHDLVSEHGPVSELADGGGLHQHEHAWFHQIPQATVLLPVGNDGSSVELRELQQ